MNQVLSALSNTKTPLKTREKQYSYIYNEYSRENLILVKLRFWRQEDCLFLSTSNFLTSSCWLLSFICFYQLAQNTFCCWKPLKIILKNSIVIFFDILTIKTLFLSLYYTKLIFNFRWKKLYCIDVFNP